MTEPSVVGIASVLAGLKAILGLNQKDFPPCNAKLVKNFPWERYTAVHCQMDGDFSMKKVRPE